MRRVFSKEEITNPKATIKRLWGYLKEKKMRLMIILFMVILATVATIIGPILISKAIDKLIVQKQIQALRELLLLLGLIYLLAALFNYLSGLMMVLISEEVLFNLRRDLFNHLERLSLSFFDKNKRGDLMSRFTNDISVIGETLSNAIIQVINSILIVIGVTIVMFIINPILAFTTILTIPLFTVFVFKIGRKTGQYYKQRQETLGLLNAYAEERISGIKVVKSYGKEEEAIFKFTEHNDDFKKTSIKAQLYSGLIMPVNIATTNLGNVLIIAMGALMTVGGLTTVGSILAFLTYSKMFRRPISQLATIYSSIQASLAGAERVFDILDQEIEVKEVTNPLELKKVKGQVEFKEVNFGYDKNKLILKDINLEVNPGESVALVGETGAGKTTIINLLSRFYDLNSGLIMIDGKDISKARKADLRHKIGIVLQDTYLFKGTVLDNIRYGKVSASLEEVIEVCKKAQAHSFIRRLPDGYYSLVEEGGTNFSHGQRQLISIARALLANHEILILDEATSNVDTRTEIAIQSGMKKLMKDKTSFIIAHRLSTIKKADQILVIDKGKIVEQGNHKTLIKKKGFYYHLYNSQFDN